MIKKLFRKAIVDEKGAVSIYLVVVSLFLLLFCGVLIDYARIMVAERQTEDALKSGLRTTMANMGPFNGYGLFGLDPDAKPEEILEKAVKENLVIEDGDYFQFVDTTLENLSYSHDDSKMLANEYTFENQILEDMKYRAPVEFTIEVIDAFSKITDAMEQASILVDLAAEVDKEAQKREDHLDKVKQHLENAKKELDGVGGKINGTSATFPSVGNIGDIASHFSIYEQILAEQSLPEEERTTPYSLADANQFVENARNFVRPLLQPARKAGTELDKALSELEKARIRNDHIIDLIEKKKTEANNQYNKAKQMQQQHGQGGNNGGIDEAGTKIEEAGKNLDDYVMDTQFFTKMKELIEDAKQKVGGAGESNTFIYWLDHLESVVENLSGSYEQGLSDVVNDVKATHQSAITAVNTAIDYFTNNRKSYRTDEVAEQEKQAEQQRNASEQRMRKTWEEALMYADDVHAYVQLREAVTRYNGQASGTPTEMDFEESNQLADDAMNMVDLLFENLGEVFENARNKLYINEYILTRFKSHDFTLTGADAFMIETNEVEYLIYGLDSTHANFYAAMTELFALRFAVNFVESFVARPTAATGPLAFWAGVAYALLQTNVDMQEIQRGRKIEFFYRTRIQTDYRDYLRLFMLLHAEGSKLQRIMALIDYKEGGKDLTKVPTYINAEVETSVDLWFLPVVADMMAKTNILDGDVENGRYVIKKKASFSY